VHLLVFLKICIHLINARNMEHVMLYSPLMDRSSQFEKRWNKSSREDESHTAIPKFPFSRNLKVHCRVYKIPFEVLRHRTYDVEFATQEIIVSFSLMTSWPCGSSASFLLLFCKILCSGDIVGGLGAHR